MCNRPDNVGAVMTLTLQYAAGEDERHRLHHAQDRHEEPMEVGVFANSNKVMTPKNKKTVHFTEQDVTVPNTIWGLTSTIDKLSNKVDGLERSRTLGDTDGTTNATDYASTMGATLVCIIMEHTDQC